jgi:hypothetical protein
MTRQTGRAGQASRRWTGKMKSISTILLILGGFICCLNLYLSVPRYLLHKYRGGKKEDYNWISGIPVVGSLLVALSLLVFWQINWILAVSVIFFLIDTGGPHWFAGTMIYHQTRGRGGRC